MSVKPETDLVPRGEIIATFGTLLAVSPEIYGGMLERMAKRHGVSVDELKPFVTSVLRELPPYDD